MFFAGHVRRVLVEQGCMPLLEVCSKTSAGEEGRNELVAMQSEY